MAALQRHVARDKNMNTDPYRVLKVPLNLLASIEGEE